MLWKNIWNKKKSFLKIELMCGGKSQGSYIEPLDKPVPLHAENDEFKLSLVRMSKKEYAKLPEFTGF